MDPDAIVDLLRKQPFEPFAMQLHDGRNFEVLHPELVLVAKRSIFLGWYKNGKGKAVDEWVILSSLAIASLHTLVSQ